MSPIFANRLLLPHGRKAAEAVLEAISKSINEKTVTALIPATRSENLGNKYLNAIDTSLACEITSGLIICTSGSTGNPKAVELSSAALMAAAKMVNDKFREPATWLLAINPAFIGGVMVLARAHIGNQEWEYGLDENDKFSPDLFISVAQKLFAQNKKVRTSLVTAQLMSLVAQEYVEFLKKFDTILVGGGQLSTDTFEELRSQGINLIRTYGMTETSGGVVWDGLALEDVAIRIEGGTNNPAGRISIKSPTNATCYHGNSEGIKKLNSATFNANWVLTQDIGSYSNSFLKIIGRSDDIVVSGGNNVSVHAVENVLRDQPGVEDAVVFGIPDSTWGTIISAVIVGQADELSLQNAVEKELGSAAKPRLIKFAHEIPLLPNGKIDIDSLK
jgi:O-succinylbenzoic acid--CoA ligase